MSYWQHHRTDAHHATEDCSTVVLTTDIGRYATGTSLCDVLTDFAVRLGWLHIDYTHGFSVFGLASYLAPYDPGNLGGSLLGIFGIDAYVLGQGTGSFGIDAEIIAYFATEQATFGINAYILDIELVECD